METEEAAKVYNAFSSSKNANSDKEIHELMSGFFR
jgi:hypothetical protein